MAYDKNQASPHVFNELGYEYIELEFILEKPKESPKVETKESEIEKFTLGPKLTRKALRKNRRKRQKTFIKFESPRYSNVYAPAERRMSG